MPLLIPLICISGQEVRHLRLQRLNNELLGPGPNATHEGILAGSIFFRCLATLWRRVVSTLWLCWMSRNTHGNPRCRVFSTHVKHHSQQ